MGGHRYSTTAAQQLRALQAERERTGYQTAPTDGTRSSTHTSPALADLVLSDHLEKTTRELVDRTYQAIPTAGLAPEEIDDLYAWSERAAQSLPRERRLVHDAMMLRQSLEHALLAGDDARVQAVVRFESCPRCECWGLYYSRVVRAVMCAVSRCTDRDGRPSNWSLQQISERRVAREAALHTAI